MAKIPKSISDIISGGKKADDEKPVPTKAIKNRDGTVAGELADTLDKRFQKISGQGEEKKGLGKFFSFGDSTKTILKSIEASMFVQTEFLEDINDTLKERLSLQKDSLDDQDRAARLASVSEAESGGNDDKEESNSQDPKTLWEKIKEGAKEKTKPFVPQEEDSLGKKLLKSLGLVLGGGYIASGFVKNLSEKAFKKIPGVSDEGADKASTITGDAVGTGTGVGIGVTLLKKFGLTRIGGLKAFATAAVAKATYDTIGELDVDKDGKLMGLNKELVQGVGAGVTGIGTFVGIGKSFQALGKSLKGSLNFAKSKLGMKADVPKTPKAPNLDQMTKGATNATKANVPKVTSTSSKVAKAVTKIPSAINLDTAGTSVQQTINSNSTIDAVGDAIKASKPERFAKFSKFFKFAGPAAAIIPALIEPALAIYNDAPDSVVRKEIAGAVGSISGGSLGLLAGSSAGAALGLGAAGVGAVPGGLIGGFIGGIGGAFAGEWLAEKVTDALMGGPEINPKDINKLIDEKKDKSSGITPSAKISSAVAPTSEQKVADAQVKADDAGKALSDFESTAKSAKTVQKEDAFGDMVDTVVYDNAAEQAQFDKLSGAKFDADYAVEDATSEMITGDSFNAPGQFEKLQFLQEKGYLPEGESQIVMGKFVDGPLKGFTPDEAISMYVTQEASFDKSATEFKAGDKAIPTIAPDMTKPKTADGKIPAKITPADTGGFANATATGDDMGLSVEEAEKQLTDAKGAFAQAEEDGSIYEGFRQDELQADIQFAEKDLADANARAAASGDFVKRKPEPVKGIMETSGIQSTTESEDSADRSTTKAQLGEKSERTIGIESMPEKLISKSQAISEDKATQDSQAKGIMMQNLNKAGDSVTNTNVGGSSSTVNIVSGGGGRSLANHTPVSQSG